MHDRPITISAAGSRRALLWPAQTLYWSEMIDKLRTPVRSTETLDEYLKMPKSQQDDLKDVGGYVGGLLQGGRRKAGRIAGRDVITLDLDNIPPGGTGTVHQRVAGLGCGYALYSTRKHHAAAPRIRVLVPLNRTITADEYEPIARKLAEFIGLEYCDQTTFQVHRLMYWPSCCKDSQYLFHCEDKRFLDADGMLKLYDNWQDIHSWPRLAGTENLAKHATKQGDPRTKPGVVGAFCRVYDIPGAIDQYLSDAYEPCEGQDGRFTFTGGSTAGGALLYDNGLFLYSHHATDPAGGRLVNAFDLVRLHLFGDADDEAKEGTPVNRLPSYTQMCQFAVNDPDVSSLMRQERYQQATEAFTAIRPPDIAGQFAPDEDPSAWMDLLDYSSLTNKPVKSSKNVRIMLENDPLLRGRIFRDDFAERAYLTAPVPWAPRFGATGIYQWGDDDDAGIRDYTEQVLGFRSREIIEDALRLCSAGHAINPVTAYLDGLVWDGVPRLDTIYIDYFGAEDSTYIRAVARKALVGAVARAKTPGVKFDYMTVICGGQGIGKSTFCRRLGRAWFSDSVVSFEGKDGAELIQGIWIVEIAELQGLSRSDINTVKQFLSRQDDQYRAAFGRKTEKHERRCIFFGTTNNDDYLHDTTGNRRFWPVDAGAKTPTKSVFYDLSEAEVDQIWAEAYQRWLEGEELFLDAELEAEADIRRAGHVERDPLQGQIEEFLEREVPVDWHSWNLERRRMYWSGAAIGDIPTVKRDRVCVAEIMRECLGDNRAVINRQDANRITAILSRISGWEKASTVRFGGGYGTQKGFKRAKNVNQP